MTKISPSIVRRSSATPVAASEMTVVSAQSPDVRVREARYFGVLLSFAAIGSSSPRCGQYEPRMS